MPSVDQSDVMTSGQSPDRSVGRSVTESAFLVVLRLYRCHVLLRSISSSITDHMRTTAANVQTHSLDADPTHSPFSIAGERLMLQLPRVLPTHSACNRTEEWEERRSSRNGKRLSGRCCDAAMLRDASARRAVAPTACVWELRM